jgi:hypothetical protein
MRMPTLLVATWGDGLFSVNGASIRQELAGQSVRSLVDDGQAGVLAVVDGQSLCRRSLAAEWTTVFTSESKLACCVRVGDVVFVGTDDARILRVDVDGRHAWLTGFDSVDGRDRWYAGSAMVDGKLIGPPLGIRSMAATCDGAVLFANVHVGGIPRSTDGGLTWQPTIDIDADVHQVCTHPARPDLVIAAAAVGLCISRDAGATWEIERQGLHALHCSAVAFGQHEIFVSASTDPFASHGAVYRRPIDGDDPLRAMAVGTSSWLDGVVDTGCIVVSDSTIAMVDMSGRLCVSQDHGETWSTPFARDMVPGGLHLLTA